MIINPNKLTELEEIVLFVEEAFDINAVFDMTKRFLSDGYIASYNMPVDQKIYDKLKIPGGNLLFIHELNLGSYDDDPRASEYKKYNQHLESEEDMK